MTGARSPERPSLYRLFFYFFSVEEGIVFDVYLHFAFSFSGYRSHFNKWGVDVCVCVT